MSATTLALDGAQARERYGDALHRRYARAGDPADLEALVVRHRGLARSLARRFAHTSHAFDDLEQVACLGLVKAIKRFDPARGCAFATFAVPTITGELKRYCRDAGWAAHVPRPMQERARAVRRCGEELATQRRRSPTVREIAGRLGLEQEQVVDALCAAAALAPVPLDSGSDEEDERGPAVADRLGAEDAGYELAECRAALERALPQLGAREKVVLRLRFAEDLTHEQIAARLGIPTGQVARLVGGALHELALLVGDVEPPRTRRHALAA